MELRNWITGQLKGVHTVFESDIWSVVPHERLTERPDDFGNSIAWLMWHLARTEDVVVNAISRDRPQLLEDGWGQKIGVEDTRIGTGLQEEEVAEFSERVEISALKDYWDALHAQTLEWLGSSSIEVLDEIPNFDSRLESVGDIGPGGVEALMAFWRGRKIGFLLSAPVISHGYIHIGEMQTIKGRLGYRGF